MEWSRCLILLLPLTLVSSSPAQQRGGFTPIQRSAARSSDKPWWGPARSADAMQYPELRSQLYQGDILLPPEADQRNAVKIKKYLWPNGIVPYQIAANYTTEEAEMVMEGIRVLMSRTCIKFVLYEKKKHVEHIEFRKVPGKGCYAMIGRRPGKKDALPVNLQSPDCFSSAGVAEHEMLHVLGLMHEQARPDRDDHVTVHWENIDKAYYGDFSKGHEEIVTTHDLPYDYKSIMHYPRWAFSMNSKFTITAKGNPNLILGQRDGPTDIDFQKVRLMYHCSNEY